MAISTRTHMSAAIVGLHTAIALLAAGCTDVDDPNYGEASSSMSVSAYTSNGCTTAVVLGLSTQIADEMSCLAPESLTAFSPGSNVTFSSNAVLPYMAPEAKAALLDVTVPVQINSAFRTVAQQYLLYQWYLQGRCGIVAAATPGNSNHQSARAVDLANYASVIDEMQAVGWSHSIPGDPVHFDHLETPDYRGMDVLAFQRLWNRNNPADPIDEDGLYGPQTEARVRQAPALGFETGAMCGPKRVGVATLSIDGPDRIAPRAHATYAIVVENSGEVDWPSTTRVRVAGGAASALYDDATWTSPTEVGPIGVTIAAGRRGTLALEIVGPDVTEETAVTTQFELADNDLAFGTIGFSVTVTPLGDHDFSGEAFDEHDEAPDVGGGCAAGGGGPGTLGFGVMLAAGLAMRRRRGGVAS